MFWVLVTVFEISVALAFGFVLGRIYQIRSDELKRRNGFALPPTARIPHPTLAGAGARGSTKRQSRTKR